MTYLTYGELHARANRAGLVMSRDSRTSAINLRYRDPTGESQPAWRGLSMNGALAVVRSVE